MKATITVVIEFEDPDLPKDKIKEVIEESLITENGVLLLGEQDGDEWVNDYYQLYLNSTNITHIEIA
jgi:hypothetical protein